MKKNGRDFYRTLTGKAKNEKAGEIFKYLTGQEERHIVIFQKLLEKKEQYQPQGLDADQYYAYMSTLASEYVFTQKNTGGEIAAKTTGDQEAIELGIEFEKGSILFYEGMKKMVPEYDLGIVEELISEERDHLKQLRDLKKTL